MKTRLFLLATLFLSLIVSCKDDKDDNNNNNNNNDQSLNDKDKQFLTMAAYSNYAEIDAAQLAGTKATDTAVKNFSFLMVTEHQMALNELKSLAQNRVTLPTGPDQAHITLKQQLSAMSGRKFDSTYIHLQVTDHQAAETLFKDEINNGKNADVKNYANKYLPHIQMHLTKAISISSKY
jgi:putative membrane protein